MTRPASAFVTTLFVPARLDNPWIWAVRWPLWRQWRPV